jgi:hypothetical protein
MTGAPRIVKLSWRTRAVKSAPRRRATPRWLATALGPALAYIRLEITYLAHRRVIWSRSWGASLSADETTTITSDQKWKSKLSIYGFCFANNLIWKNQTKNHFNTWIQQYELVLLIILFDNVALRDSSNFCFSLVVWWTDLPNRMVSSNFSWHAVWGKFYFKVLSAPKDATVARICSIFFLL